MKKLLTIAIAFVAFLSVSNAQVGIRAGLNLANQTFDFEGVTIEPDNQIGFHFGVDYTKMINETLSFRPGLLFSMKGSKLDIDGADGLSAKFNYLEIPLDFVYNAGAINIHAGPYLGFLMSAKNGDQDVKEETESLDYGLNLGAAYNINEQIAVGLNYGLGLANIAKTESDDDGTAKNKVIAIFVSYKL